MGTDFTAPLPIPKVKPKRDTSHRTKLVVPNSERQLELAWTEAMPHEDTLTEDRILPASDTLDAQRGEGPAGAEILPRRAYPLAYDPDGPAGPALALLNSAKEESVQAITDCQEGDIESVGSRINVIAALMAKAYPHTAFNPALGAIVSFLRRATLMVDATQLGLHDLMELAKATRVLADNPLLSLESSADLIIGLEEQDWTGADPNVAALVSALFGIQSEESPDISLEQKQEKSILD